MTRSVSLVNATVLPLVSTSQKQTFKCPLCSAPRLRSLLLLYESIAASVCVVKMSCTFSFPKKSTYLFRLRECGVRSQRVCHAALSAAVTSLQLAGAVPAFLFFVRRHLLCPFCLPLCWRLGRAGRFVLEMRLGDEPEPVADVGKFLFHFSFRTALRPAEGRERLPIGSIIVVVPRWYRRNARSQNP